MEKEIQNTDIAKLKAAEKTAANTNVINAIFKILRQMMPQVKKIRNSVKKLKDFQTYVSEQINVLKTENDALKNRILKLEIKNSSRGLIIKRMKIKTKKGETESQFHLKKSFDSILERNGINPIQGKVWNYVMGQGWANFAQIFCGPHKFSK